MNDSATSHALSGQNGSTQIEVRIPRGLRSKQRLFALFARVLRFPPYFGWNWDAFEECLRDLSWLPAQTTVKVIHEDTPFAAGSRDRNIYTEIMLALSDSPSGAVRLEGCSIG